VNVNTANAQTLLAVVCAGAPEAPLCNDPEQMSIFLMAITLAREVTQGAPIFKSKKSFISAMRGKGKGVGSLFAALGLEPVEFKDTKIVERAIQTESRVFSIYVDGTVPGMKREAHVRLHTVVDMRSANETNEKAEAIQDEAEKNPNEQATPEELAQALASDPLGVIIYHRIE
jgi:general secretion pathway protein K